MFYGQLMVRLRVSRFFLFGLEVTIHYCRIYCNGLLPFLDRHTDYDLFASSLRQSLLLLLLVAYLIVIAWSHGCLGPRSVTFGHIRLEPISWIGTWYQISNDLGP